MKVNILTQKIYSPNNMESATLIPRFSEGNTFPEHFKINFKPLHTIVCENTFAREMRAHKNRMDFVCKQIKLD